ncbi:flagellar basal body P-ring formation chaperone FlgA, partial [Oleiphilus sp. HI0128]
QLSDVEGMVARRSIRPGSTIQPGHLTPPKLVKRGDNVVIVASNSAISVRMNGTAMTDGALGQQIPVQNLQSKRVVKARVSEPGLVIITL